MPEDMTVGGVARRGRPLRRPPPQMAATPPRAAFFRRRRFLFAALIVVAAVGALIYMGVRGSSMYYMTVAELRAQADTVYGDKIRLWATLARGSLHSGPSGRTALLRHA